MTIDLRLPCIEFEARIFPHGEKSPSQIERAALTYVKSGTDANPVHFDDLYKFLGLGRPAVLDLITKLWRRGWVEINLENGNVGLTTQLENFIKDATGPDIFDGLGTTVQPEVLSFVYDLTCGQVFPRPLLIEPGHPRFTYGPG